MSNQTLVVASAVPELDVDAFGVDMGVGGPVVALQVKQSKGDCCMTYSIYTLQQPPVLVRRITGGEFFSASDTDLDGRVEVWTDDAAAVDGFENLRLRDIDFSAAHCAALHTRQVAGRGPPSFVPISIRKSWPRGPSSIPRIWPISKLATANLCPAPSRPPDSAALRSAKMKVLEIAWSYLYSGREKDAWSSLAEMWPGADLDRIRGAISTARARGIRSQVDEVLHRDARRARGDWQKFSTDNRDHINARTGAQRRKAPNANHSAHSHPDGAAAPNDSSGTGTREIGGHAEIGDRLGGQSSLRGSVGKS